MAARGLLEALLEVLPALADPGGHHVPVDEDLVVDDGHHLPSSIRSSRAEPTSSTSGIPASTMARAPRFGYRPVSDGAALTIATGRAASRPWAATQSTSSWSMMATSPFSRRGMRFLVRRSIRAGPAVPAAAASPAGSRRSQVTAVLRGARRHGGGR